MPITQISYNRSRWWMLLTMLVLSTAWVGCDDDEEETGDNNPPAVTQDNTIVGVASRTPEFSMLVAAVQRAGLVDTLKGTGPFTVFAPTNEAFAAAGITDVNAIPADQVRQVLLYHVISGSTVKAADVRTSIVPSALDVSLFLNASSGVTVNGGSASAQGANVVATDFLATNGVLHAIDRVLLPPDIVGCAQIAGLTQLATAAGAAAPLPDGTTIVDALKAPGPYTVFAPTNEAFEALGGPVPPETLRNVLLYHVLGSKVASTAIPASANSLLKNTWGNGVTLLFSTTSGVKVNTANVAVADVKCTNGIVHVIDQVLLPPNVVEMASIAGLTTLADLVGQASEIGDTPFIDYLQQEGPFTVLAPTNAAFATQFGDTPPTDSQQIRDLLSLHVVEAEAPVLSTGLPSGDVSTLSGGTIEFDATVPSVTSVGTPAPGASIGPADIHVTNGVIHVIDKVLLPNAT
jgi:transforming growth factor-beta-induced protein